MGNALKYSTVKDVTMVVRYCICGEEEAQGPIVEIKPTY